MTYLRAEEIQENIYKGNNPRKKLYTITKLQHRRADGLHNVFCVDFPIVFRDLCTIIVYHCVLDRENRSFLQNLWADK